MNIKRKLASVLVAGALLASGSASATLEWAWQGTLNDWATSNYSGLGTILDSSTLDPHPPGPGLNVAGPGDGDTTFTLNISTFDPNLTNVTLKEEEIAGVDLYNVGFGWVGAVSTGMVAYTISTTDPDGLNLVDLDTVVSLVGDVTKEVYDKEGGTLLLTLESINGSRVPLTGMAGFPTLSSIYVVDTIKSGAINDIHNEYSVPEPGSIFLLGVGLMGLVYGRRKMACRV